MKKLVIKGHPTEGNKVIEILEMLGGTNIYHHRGGDSCVGYTIEENEIRTISYIFGDEDFIILSIEEFLEKYPYKIKDRVIVPNYGEKVCIIGMFWKDSEVLYEVVTDKVERYSAKELNEFNKPNKEKRINQVSLANCDLDEVEIVLGDKFELKIEDGKYYAVKKKSQYPKTYEECCEILGSDPSKIIVLSNRKDIIHEENKHCYEMYNLYQLLICRDAYWKIAGEQMGLGKLWEPDYRYRDEYYSIYYNGFSIIQCNSFEAHTFIFPTEEMRDAFYERFKDLIEECKELL